MIICTGFGIVLILVIGYILIKAVIGIIKGIYHGIMKILGRE